MYRGGGINPLREVEVEPLPKEFYAYPTPPNFEGFCGISENRVLPGKLGDSCAFEPDPRRNYPAEQQFA